MEIGTIQETQPRDYVAGHTIEELEQKVFQGSGMDSVQNMAEQSARIQKRYRAVGNEYIGWIGAAKQLADTVGLTSFETRLKRKIQVGKKHTRELEAIVREGSSQASALTREIAQTNTKQIYAKALMTKYTDMMTEIDDTVEAKDRQYDQMINGSDFESSDSATLADEIHQLGVDRGAIRESYDKASIVIIQGQSSLATLTAKKAMLEHEVMKTRASMLKGQVQIGRAECNTKTQTSPYRVAKSIYKTEVSTNVLGTLNSELGGLMEEMSEVLSGLTIDDLEDHTENTRTTKLQGMVNEERDVWGAKAKKIMDAKRSAS